MPTAFSTDVVHELLCSPFMPSAIRARGIVRNLER